VLGLGLLALALLVLGLGVSHAMEPIRVEWTLRGTLEFVYILGAITVRPADVLEIALDSRRVRIEGLNASVVRIVHASGRITMPLFTEWRELCALVRALNRSVRFPTGA
jgi:hypothetical protein